MLLKSKVSLWISPGLGMVGWGLGLSPEVVQTGTYSLAGWVVLNYFGILVYMSVINLLRIKSTFYFFPWLEGCC